jgi:polyketide cyclase/dehydrase/lipid transport protein
MSRGRRGVVRIEVEHRFGVSVIEGFEYITEPANWPAYWPRFVRLDRGSRWRAPGDRARITLRMLAREVELEMTLARFEDGRVVEYTSEQRGLPAARHWRHFQEADSGFTYRIVIEYFPRAGWRGLLDRTLVRQAITNTARETIRNLESRFREQRQPTDGAAGVARGGGRR